MSKSKRIARNEVINNQNEEIMESQLETTDSPIIESEVAPIEVPEVAETLAEKVVRIKREQAEKLAYYNEMKKELDAQVKKLKADEILMKAAAKEAEAKIRFDKLAAKLHRPEDSKKNAVINAILGGADSMEMVAEWTGFDQKYVSDTIWGLEKACNLR